MLSKKYRLIKDKDFKGLYRRSPKLKGRFISIRYAENNLGTSRFGFIVPNKTIAKATQRNIQKRKLREVIKQRLNRIKPGFDVIIKLEKAPRVIKLERAPQVIKPERVSRGIKSERVTKDLENEIEILLSRCQLLK